jgi:uncharacterized protein (DUF4415 family)
LIGNTDLARVDAHVVQPDEYDELPELTDEMMARAEIHEGGRLVRRGRGRPKMPVTKEQVTLRLDPDVLAAWRGTGPGWQARVNEALRRTAPGLAE